MGATFPINMRVNLRYECEFSVKGAAGARTEHLPSNPAAMKNLTIQIKTHSNRKLLCWRSKSPQILTVAAHLSGK